MAQVLLIDPKGVTGVTHLKGNIDRDKLRIQILATQEVSIEEVLGSKLYQKLLGLMPTAINDAENGAYKTLLVSYIQPMLAWYTAGDFVLMGSFEMSEAGNHSRSAEGASPADGETLAKAGENMKTIGDRYRRRCVGYLCENSSSFAEYTADQDGQIQAQQTDHKSNWRPI